MDAGSEFSGGTNSPNLAPSAKIKLPEMILIAQLKRFALLEVGRAGRI
jgi:hypothetical protein